MVDLKGYETNIETGEKVTPDTLFGIGSTTKIFTAAARVARRFRPWFYYAIAQERDSGADTR